jgi:hypothetical protein
MAAAYMLIRAWSLLDCQQHHNKGEAHNNAKALLRETLGKKGGSSA